jgi:TPR repeat protein
MTVGRWCFLQFLVLVAVFLFPYPTFATIASTDHNLSCDVRISQLRNDAELGNTNAQYALGVSYHKGECVIQDLKEATKWYSKAAEHGNCHAQYNLGYMYHNGNGVKQNSVEAAKWYRQAADQGNTRAQFNLALLYHQGDGVQKNDIEAIKWYTRSANQGDPEAQNNLAWLYFAGKGVPKDNIIADKWFLLAKQNKAAFRTILSKFYIELSMSPIEIARAEEQAALWKQTIETKDCGHYCQSCTVTSSVGNCETRSQNQTTKTKD